MIQISWPIQICCLSGCDSVASLFDRAGEATCYNMAARLAFAVSGWLLKCTRMFDAVDHWFTQHITMSTVSKIPTAWSSALLGGFPVVPARVPSVASEERSSIVRAFMLSSVDSSFINLLGLKEVFIKLVAFY